MRQQFTAKERDTDMGLDYFGARFYASTQGRFTSTDPLMASAYVENPQSWNRYTYALNNPLKYVDPEGLKSEPVFGSMRICLMTNGEFSGTPLSRSVTILERSESLQYLEDRH